MSYLLRHLSQKVLFGIAGLFMLLLVTACTGVSGYSVPGSGTSSPVTSANNPTTSGNQGPAAAGSISWIGQVQSVNGNSIVVNLPNGQALTMNIINGQTDLSDFNGALPNQGQLVKVKATVNTTNGSLVATELKPAEIGDSDQNIVEFKGVTTSTVGADNVLHFKVGSTEYSFTLNTMTDLTDFQNNAGSIPANQAIKVKVQFQGTTATVLKVENPNSPD